MDDNLLAVWSEEVLSFRCPNCAFANLGDWRSYNFVGALDRLDRAVNSGNHHDATRSERLLLRTYNISLPRPSTATTPESSDLDEVSTCILKNFHPVILADHKPVKTTGDGNCLFRAISRGMVGHEGLHLLIRLLSALEMLENQHFYDTSASNYTDLIQDPQLVIDPYSNLIRSVCRVGRWGEMLHLYAASTAISLAFMSYCPPVLHEHFFSRSLTRTVCGRTISRSAQPSFTIMWSSTSVPKTQTHFIPNHFVLLHNTTTPRIIHIDLTGSSSTEDKTSYVDCSSPPASPLPPSSSSPLLAGSTSSPTSPLAPASPLPLSPTSPLSSSSSPTSDNDTAPVAPGGHDLTFPGKFLEMKELISLLRKDAEPHIRIPMGTKENQYFFFNNAENLERRKRKQKCIYWDDCGAWVSGASNTTFIIQSDDNTFQEVIFKDGVYGIKQRKSVKGVRKATFTPLDNQPSSEDVLEIHRAYAKHTQSSDYKRRISWMLQPGKQLPPIAVAEYTGTFPGRTTHGNSTHKTDNYLRMPPAALEKIKQDTETKPAKQVYRQNLLNTSDIVSRPRNYKQVENARYRQKKKDQPESQRGNFADQLQTLQSMAATHPFVQNVSYSKDKIPTVTLYLKEQLHDIRRFCCGGPTTTTTVLGFDKTFNLGEVHLTIGVFKNLSVINRRTNEHPIFPGPIFLHGNSDFQTYSSFFTHIAASLGDTPASPIIGSDDEKYLRKSIKSAFPLANTLICTRHLKTNITDYLKDKVGANAATRTHILQSIFGPQGIVNAEDEITFTHLAENTKTLCNAHCPKFSSYLESRILPILQGNLQTHIRTPNTHAKLTTWTNNNCESINAALKRIVEWKPQQLVDLVHKIYDMVRAQYKELEMSIVGQGDLVLHNSFKKYAVPIHVWCLKNQWQRDNHLRKFLRQPLKLNANFLESTDGECVVLAPGGNGGKKPGQVKRKRAAKTRSIPASQS